MNTPFTTEEVRFLLAWAKEDHQGLCDGPARRLQKMNGLSPAVLGQLFARLSTELGRSQHDLVEGPAPEAEVTWPWPTQAVLERRLQVLLPENTLRYLEEIGALTFSSVTS